MVALPVAALVALSACTATPGTPAPPTPKELATAACVDACKQALAKGQEIGPGPCLLDPIPGLDDWVCDVAHNPRKLLIDNKIENQCLSYREARSAHFVEVDPECKVITAK